jgi:pyruvate formate lyase activating enzyme
MEQKLYKQIDSEKSMCLLCSHFCILKENEKGKCGVRQNSNGKIISLVKNIVAAGGLDPVEKKPLFHVLPGSFSYSIGSPGCNFSCTFCQNADLAQGPAITGNIEGVEVRPEDIVQNALHEGAESISYTYSEPTVFFELMKSVAEIASKKGLLNLMVSNGFISEYGLDCLDGLIDAANIDLKAFNNNFYEKYCGAKLKPVLDTLKRMKKKNIFTEVTTLLIPGKNDSDKEINEAAAFIKNELGEDTPWHISAFRPTFRMTDVPPTPSSSIYKAIETGTKHGLKYIYSGNISENDYESTYCPGCRNKLIARKRFYVIENRIVNGKCDQCATQINGIFR